MTVNTTSAHTHKERIDRNWLKREKDRDKRWYKTQTELTMNLTNVEKEQQQKTTNKTNNFWSRRANVIWVSSGSGSCMCVSCVPVHKFVSVFLSFRIKYAWNYFAISPIFHFQSDAAAAAYSLSRVDFGGRHSGQLFIVLFIAVAIFIVYSERCVKFFWQWQRNQIIIFGKHVEPDVGEFFVPLSSFYRSSSYLLCDFLPWPVLSWKENHHNDFIRERTKTNRNQLMQRDIMSNWFGADILLVREESDPNF